jgi:hypothetical protein
MIFSSLIIDSGASVCISPHKSDFITYNKSSMKIKDLYSSNQVAGEGIDWWLMQDDHGILIQIELLEYHMPKADVRLLSPQVPIKTIGGQSLQMDKMIDVTLNNGIKLFAQYCPQSNLPLIPLTLHTESTNSFWNAAFGFTTNNVREINAIKSILLQFNSNLSHFQKDLLLWHQQLFHALISWIQLIMRERTFLPCIGNESALYSGPLIRTKSCASNYDTSKLKCVACLYAKALIRSPSNQPPCHSVMYKTLTTDHLKPGNCISANHYFSPI